MFVIKVTIYEQVMGSKSRAVGYINHSYRLSDNFNDNVAFFYSKNDLIDFWDVFSQTPYFKRLEKYSLKIKCEVFEIKEKKYKEIEW